MHLEVNIVYVWRMNAALPMDLPTESPVLLTGPTRHKLTQTYNARSRKTRIYVLWSTHTILLAVSLSQLEGIIFPVPNNIPGEIKPSRPAK